MIRNVIFDWSGTLVDDLPAVWKATNFVFTQAGVRTLTLDEFRAEFRLPFRTFYDRFTPDVPLPQLETWFHGHFRENQDSVVELPHAREFLLFLQSHQVRTFVLSSVHPDRGYLGVWDKRAVIHQLLDENQLVPGETLYIGDMEHDIETARHGAVHSCAVLTGYNNLDQLRAASPDLIVEHLGELRKILDQGEFEFPRPAFSAEATAEQRPVITVGAVIANAAGEILMIRTHKWSNLWGIPGGKTKYGESSLDALRREIKEETDLEIDGIEFVLVQDCVESPEFYRPAHFVLLNYFCRVAGAEQVRLNEEANAYRWLRFEAALQLPLNTPTRRLLEVMQKDQSLLARHG
jgi:phosphoglycolate phosphatase-like HAD superfamily hydrolase/ADP-ribose pyrophosphatase YjhB (NUDIX family)